MRFQRRRRTGIATLVAVALVAVAGTAATAVMASLVRDARRTREAVEDAQVRQLLLAGAMSVVQKAGGWSGAPEAGRWEISLPEELVAPADGQKKIAIAIEKEANPLRRTANVTVVFGGGTGRSK